MVYDGNGAPPEPWDVGLAGDRIAEVGLTVSGRAAEVLDVRGLALAPGFIDIHAHDDFAAILHPEMEYKLCGGVTTSVVGNCGFGPAPFATAREHAAAFVDAPERLPEWEGHAGYAAYLDGHPASANIAMLVGHGTLRRSVMGADRRAPSRAHVERMREALREGLDAGALGMSTGLAYEPGCQADNDEILTLVDELVNAGRAIYATHIRDEATWLLASINEAIEVCEQTGVPLQISHHKALGRAAWGLVHESLGLIEEAQARGLDVHCDQYPYTASCTSLAQVVRQERLREDPTTGLRAVEPNEAIVASAPSRPSWQGRSIADIAADWNMNPGHAAAMALAVAPDATVVLHTMDEGDVRTVMRHPSTMIGSDGMPVLDGMPHPRLYGSFARVLGRYARQLGLFPLEEALQRMTGLPARKLGLKDRGVIRKGAFADLVLFDPATILDNGTYAEPHQHPTGIAHVFVNGVRVVESGKHTGARPGRMLRRG